MAQDEEQRIRIFTVKFFESLKKTLQEDYKRKEKGKEPQSTWNASTELKALDRSEMNKIKDCPDSKSISENCIIHFAALYDDVELCRTLFDLGADPGVTNKLGSTALHLACSAGSVDCIEYLTQFTTDNESNKIGNTPLHCAILSGKLEAVKALIHAYKDINIREALRRPNLTTFTPGMLSGNFEDIASFLVEACESN